jgi:hypothetical protein
VPRRAHGCGSLHALVCTLPQPRPSLAGPGQASRASPVTPGAAGAAGTLAGRCRAASPASPRREDQREHVASILSGHPAPTGLTGTWTPPFWPGQWPTLTSQPRAIARLARLVPRPLPRLTLPRPTLRAGSRLALPAWLRPGTSFGLAHARPRHFRLCNPGYRGQGGVLPDRSERTRVIRHVV